MLYIIGSGEEIVLLVEVNKEIVTITTNYVVCSSATAIVVNIIVCS